MSLRPCPTCGALAEEGRCPRHPRSADRYRPHRPGRTTYSDPTYQQLRHLVLVAAGWQCGYCAARASSADHLLPRSRGGRTVLANLVACCAWCNTSKGPRTLVEWVASGCAPAGARSLLDRLDERATGRR